MQLRLVAASLAALLFLHPAVEAQAQDVEPQGGCGSAVTSQEAALYMELVAQGLIGQTPEGVQAPPPYCVPIFGHIVRHTDGSGGLSLTRYQQSIEDANFYFVGTGIQFYSAGVEYIDSDFYYSNIAGLPDINALRSINPVPSAVNIYYTENLPGLCGISSFTFSGVQGIAMANSCTATATNHSTVPHEIGHYFDLFHTHETAFGVEYVNGSNCTTAGDQLCDTPADPDLSGLVGPYPGCSYTSFIQDPLGATYNPDVHQIMSYTRAQCANVFSPMSRTKMTNTLLVSRPDHYASGCTPFPLPTLAATEPASAFIDMQLDVLLVGTNLGDYTTIDFGADIEVTTFTLLSPESLVVHLVVDMDAALGPRDVVVTNAFDSAVLSAYFDIRPTRRHYVSPTGGAVYPYAAPGDAATSFAAALTAVSIGDTILVDSTTVNGISYNINKSITVMGGWADLFTTRPGRTRLVLNGNVTLSPGTGGTAGIDGFILEGGIGAVEVSPRAGNYGGGVRIVGGNVSVKNCEIRNCDANPGPGFAGGGGIYAANALVDISGNDIHDCDATWGGGIYFYNASGSVTGNLIESNVVVTSGSPVYTGYGAGIAIENCSGLTLADNTIRLNTGAQNGSGVWVLNASGVIIDGGEISRNTALFTGGGVHAEGASTSVTLSDCNLLWNAAVIGAGVYGTLSSTFVRHNLFVGNNASAAAGAIFLSSPAGGEIAGNTMDRNASGGPGGVLLTNAAIDVSNNIIVNTTGDGINCSGTAPTLSYNLVSGSSTTDYVGCAPGTGAVSGDPLFADTSGTDYRLTLHSPAIDAGDPNPARSDPDGSRGDMGRYGSHAFTMAQPSYPQGFAVTPSASNIVLSWDRNPEGDVAYYAIYCDTTSGFRPSMDNFFASTPDTMLTTPAPVDSTYYVVSAVDASGYAGGYSVEASWLPGSATGADGVVRFTDALMQNVPNPFNPTTTIRFTLAAPAHVRLGVFDVAGRRVRMLIDAPRGAGLHGAVWDGTGASGGPVASGVYFYRLEAGRFAQTRKMVLLK